MLSRLGTAVRGLFQRTLARVRAVARSFKWLLTDRTARPMLGYLLAMGLGIGSVGKYLLDGPGRPGTTEAAMLFAALGVIMLTLFSLGGARPRSER